MRRRGSKARRRISVAVVSGLVLLFAILVPAAAQMADEGGAGGKFRTGDSVEIAAGETFEDNLYVLAGTIDVNGTVDGDLVAAGGQISIDGTVTGDVIIASGDLTIGGEILGDLRVAAGQLRLNGTVGGDVAVVGGTVEIDDAVGADVLFAAGQMNIGGDVAGQIYGAAGEYNRTGTVVGPEDVTVDEPDEQPTFGDRVVGGVYRLVTLFLVGALVLLMLRRPLEAVLTRARQRPGGGLVAGLVGLSAIVALLIASILVGIIWSILFGLLGFGLLVGTYWFGFVVLWVVIAFALFVLVVYAAPIITGLAGSRLVLARQDNIWVQLAALAVGLALYLVLTAIPFVGWLIGLLAVLFATGAIVLAVRNFGAPTTQSISADV
jgi:cytoskeletal protein CcmA (bactofilin family)